MKTEIEQAPPRISPLPRAQWTEQQCEAVSIIESAGTPDGPERTTLSSTLARYPELLHAFYTFGAHLLKRSSLADRPREIVTLRVAWRVRCDYEWTHHVHFAKRLGVTDAEIDGIIEGPQTQALNELERDLLRATDQLCERTQLDDEMWERLSRQFDQRQLLDLIFAIGQYVMLAMVAKSVRVQVEPHLEQFSLQHYEKRR